MGTIPPDEDRFTREHFHLPIGDLMRILAGDDAGALTVLTTWWEHNPSTAIDGLLRLDEKRLYDDRIAELYQLCGNDIDRFIYHVHMELPNQVTGKVNPTGPYLSRMLISPDD